MTTNTARTPFHRTALVAALALMGTLVFWPGSAQADDVTTAPVTWSVVPSAADGPDGRSWVELDADPGTSTREYVAIRNLGTTDTTFRITARDGYYTAAGRFNMLETAQESIAAGTWIDAPEHVQVPAGETVVVPFSITVPDNATPGDNAAGIAASVMNTGSSAQGDQLQVESRMGFKVLVRVSGELAPAAVVDKLKAKYQLSWNPFSPGRMDIAYSVRNTGNTRLIIDDEITVAGVRGSSMAGEEKTEMLPGEERDFTASINGVWPTGLAKAAVKLSGYVPETGTPAAVGEVVLGDIQGTTTVVVIPWPQLLGLLGLILLGLGLFRGRRRRLAAVEELIAEARREGELSARQNTTRTTRS